jgi:hypothetical protein
MQSDFCGVGCGFFNINWHHCRLIGSLGLILQITVVKLHSMFLTITVGLCYIQDKHKGSSQIQLANMVKQSAHLIFIWKDLLLNLAQETANLCKEFWWYSLVTPGELQSCVLQHAITMFLPVWDLGAISVVPKDLSLLGYDSVTGWVVIDVSEEHSVFIVTGDCIHGSFDQLMWRQNGPSKCQEPLTQQHCHIPEYLNGPVCSFYHFIKWHNTICVVPLCHVPQQATKHLFC